MWDTLLLNYARVWPAGLSPVAPGTCGSLVAIVLAPFIFMPLPLWGRVLVLLFVLVTGTIASSRAEKILGRKDPSEAVIDEVLGQWITILPFAALLWWEYAAAFVLFRLFDITKPWPIWRLEDIEGGLGVMIDDVAAGIYALLCMVLLRLLMGSV
ncbi:MAG: phosphatidylglycerophosphatase A [Desulfovibrionaceae bacterium]|nr:phosphatidylglycerophosphatase A [Desulfovibrionaceae bacterium]